MEALVVSESRFLQTPSGAVFTLNPILDYNYWSYYLDVFSHIIVTGRMEESDSAAVGELRSAKGPNVSFVGLPNWNGAADYYLNAGTIKSILLGALESRAVCLRGPSLVTALLNNPLQNTGRPFGMEIAGDPWESLSRKSGKTFLWPLARYKTRRDLEKLCREADATAYVTEKALQKRYPPAPSAFTTHFSDVILNDADFAAVPKKYGGGPFKIIHVGTMRTLYKAQDTILKALKIIVTQYPQTQLTLVGDGIYQKSLTQLTADLELTPNVSFIGMLPGPTAVRDELDKADLFILPSHTEGLPKALIEAMARGLPAVGSNVGGIPELLPVDCLVPPGDAAALAKNILGLMDQPERLYALAVDNLKKSREYHITSMRHRRIQYYEAVSNATETWLHHNQN